MLECNSFFLYNGNTKGTFSIPVKKGSESMSKQQQIEYNVFILERLQNGIDQIKDKDSLNIIKKTQEEIIDYMNKVDKDLQNI